MVKLPDLVSDAILRHNKFSQGAKKVRQDIDKIKAKSTTMGRSLAGVSSAFTAVGAAAAAAGVGIGSLTAAFADTSQRLDDLAKKSRKLTIGPDSLLTLRELSEDVAGVAGTQLDTALQRFARRLGEAAQGTGELKKSLDGLQLDAQMLARMPLEQAFLTYARAVGNAEGSTEQLRLANKAFDMEGTALVTLLRELTKNTELYAERLALVRERQVTDPEALQRIEEVNDKTAEVTRTMKGLQDQMILTFGPSMMVFLKETQRQLGLINRAARTIDSTFQALTSRRARTGAGMAAGGLIDALWRDNPFTQRGMIQFGARAMGAIPQMAAQRGGAAGNLGQPRFPGVHQVLPPIQRARRPKGGPHPFVERMFQAAVNAGKLVEKAAMDAAVAGDRQALAPGDPFRDIGAELRVRQRQALQSQIAATEEDIAQREARLEETRGRSPMSTAFGTMGGARAGSVEAFQATQQSDNLRRQAIAQRQLNALEQLVKLQEEQLRAAREREQTLTDQLQALDNLN